MLLMLVDWDEEKVSVSGYVCPKELVIDHLERLTIIRSYAVAHLQNPFRFVYLWRLICLEFF